MKPPSERTTPRRLMAPISRHFLPVLQPEPPAWLTTGLIKGSRLPFALYLLSGTTDCSLSFSPSALPATPATTAASLFGVGAGAGAGAETTTGATRLAVGPGTRFPQPVCFAPDGRPCLVEKAGTDFSGVTAAETGCMASASFDAAAAWLLTAFIVLRVFWIMLGLWAEARPAASTATRMVVVLVMAGFLFIVIIIILSLLLLHRCCGWAGRSRWIQVMAEIRGGQAGGHYTLTGRVLVRMPRLRISRLSGRSHRQVRDVYDALHFCQPVEETQHRVVGTVELQFERHFGVELFRGIGASGVAADLHSRLPRLSAHHAHEIVHFLFIGHDAPLDFKLLLQAGELALDVGQFRPISFQFGVLAHFGLQLDPRRVILIALRLEDRVIEAARRQRRHHNQNAQQLNPV